MSASSAPGTSCPSDVYDFSLSLMLFPSDHMQKGGDPPRKTPVTRHVLSKGFGCGQLFWNTWVMMGNVMSYGAFHLSTAVNLQ